MSFLFLQENTESRQRLEKIVRRLSKDDLARSTADGWTISSLLAHLAFWDRRALVLLLRWKQKGIDESPIDSEAMNDALKPMFIALDGQTAVEFCLSSAKAVDAEIETLSSDFVTQIEASPTHFRFSRALHRNDHINQIEMMLQGS